MNPWDVHRYLIAGAEAMFDKEWCSPEAAAMILAIGMQESDFIHRQQMVGGNRHWWQSLMGPAVGLWQFEKVGINGVLTHHATKQKAANLLHLFGYPSDVNTLHTALIHNDLLAAAFARLLLYTVPEKLPLLDSDGTEAWRQYVAAWRPGKPKPERWATRWYLAVQIVRAGHTKHQPKL